MGEFYHRLHISTTLNRDFTMVPSQTAKVRFTCNGLLGNRAADMRADRHLKPTTNMKLAALSGHTTQGTIVEVPPAGDALRRDPRRQIERFITVVRATERYSHYRNDYRIPDREKLEVIDIKDRAQSFSNASARHESLRA